MGEPYVRPFRDGYRVVQIDGGRLETQCWWSQGADKGEWRVSGQSRYSQGAAMALTAAFLDALQSHDPDAHAALVRAEAAKAGLRCLTTEQARYVANIPIHAEEYQALPMPESLALVATLRGDPPSESSGVTAYAPGENASPSGTVLADYAEREVKRGRTKGLHEHADERRGDPQPEEGGA